MLEQKLNQLRLPLFGIADNLAVFTDLLQLLNREFRVKAGVILGAYINLLILKRD